MHKATQKATHKPLRTSLRISLINPKFEKTSGRTRIKALRAVREHPWMDRPRKKAGAHRAHKATKKKQTNENAKAPWMHKAAKKKTETHTPRKIKESFLKPVDTLATGPQECMQVQHKPSAQGQRTSLNAQARCTSLRTKQNAQASAQSAQRCAQGSFSMSLCKA